MACALSEDSDQPLQGICCPLEGTLDPLISIGCSAKTLIRLYIKEYENKSLSRPGEELEIPEESQLDMQT